MKKCLTGLVAIALLGSSLAYAAVTVHWGYSGHEGPEHWGKLTPEYSTCSAGKNQSPINLTGGLKADLPPIQFDYLTVATEILNNGHTVQANFKSGSSIVVGGKAFELKQVHFHAPSENLIDGKSYPLEAHLVHADKDGNLAVVAVMYEEGQASATIDRLWSKMPEKAGMKLELAAGVNGSGLLPDNREYFQFSGSLTTPPCTEGVLWLVMKNPVTASREQVERFAHVMHHPNNRPVQSINARSVLK